MVVQTEDENNEPLTAGGDITTQWLRSPTMTSPVVEVVDYDNGRYLLTFTLQKEGEYALGVLVNPRWRRQSRKGAKDLPQ